MVYRIVLSHNQTEYLYKFKDTQRTYVVLDAMSMEDSYTCGTLGYGVVPVATMGNRSLNRNRGLMRVLHDLSPKDTDIVEFLDGDRYPMEYSPSRIEELMDKHDLGCLLYTCSVDDTRISKLGINPCTTSLVDTGTLCNPFYSCGFAMRVRDVLSIMSYNKGHLFEPKLSSWGCEDQYLGILCSHLGVRVAITREILVNGAVGGDQHMHPSYRDSLQTYIDLIQNNGIPIRNEYQAPVILE